MGSLRTASMMMVMTVLFLGVGFYVYGQTGAILALGVAAVVSLWTWLRSDRAILALYGAEEADARSVPQLIAVVHSMADRAGIPRPKVCLIETDQPNALSTGRNPAKATVVVTTGLLKSLSPDEVAGIVAHELAHIRNRDTLVMTVSAALAGAIPMLVSRVLFPNSDRNRPIGVFETLMLMSLAPFSAALVLLANSRARDLAADRIGAAICGNPEWLALALERIEAQARRIDHVAAERNPATAHLFIVNPVHERLYGLLFSNQPKTSRRIAALRNLASGRRTGLGPVPALKGRRDRPQR